MTSRDFCFWLQGYFEINTDKTQTLDGKQVEMIKKHLALVFKHEIDPSYGNKEHLDQLNEIHNSGRPDFPKYPGYDSPSEPGVMRC